MGGERGGTRTEDVHGLVNVQWTEIGRMNAIKDLAIVTVLPGDRMVAVGGASSAFNC